MNIYFPRRVHYELIPHMRTMQSMDDGQRIDAIVKMCIAHVLNGGAYTDPITTAREYLETIGE